MAWEICGGTQLARIGYAELISACMESLYILQTKILQARAFYSQSISKCAFLGKPAFCAQVLGGLQIFPSNWSMGSGLNTGPMQNVSNQPAGVRLDFELKSQNITIITLMDSQESIFQKLDLKHLH